jgi:hypothetical protein
MELRTSHMELRTYHMELVRGVRTHLHSMTGPLLLEVAQWALGHLKGHKSWNLFVRTQRHHQQAIDQGLVPLCIQVVKEFHLYQHQQVLRRTQTSKLLILLIINRDIISHPLTELLFGAVYELV